MALYRLQPLQKSFYDRPDNGRWVHNPFVLRLPLIAYRLQTAQIQPLALGTRHAMVSVMGYTQLLSSALHGVTASTVEVEVHVSRGLPTFDIVGLPEGTVKEGRKRIRSAILSCGYEFPMQKITVNLAPAEQRKGGARFDLPIAIGILTASGQLPRERTAARLFIGELALDGALRPCGGGLATLLLCRRLGLVGLHLPKRVRRRF